MVPNTCANIHRLGKSSSCSVQCVSANRLILSQADAGQVANANANANLTGRGGGSGSGLGQD